MHANIIGAIVNSAIYILLVFVAGLVRGYPVAWKLAIATAGVTYLSHLVSGLASARNNAAVMHVATFFVGVSIGLGMIAGLDLLF